VFNWPAGVPAPASVAQDVTAGTITYTITSFAAASGVYEIALPAGKLSDDNANASLVLLNAPQVIRFVYGMPALLKNAITGAAATQRAQNASFTTLVTNAASAKLSQVVAATGTRYRLQDMYTSLTRLGATNDLSSIVTGYDVAGNYTTTGPVQLNMDLSFAGLAEGTFVATRNASVTFPDASGLAEPYLRSIVLVIGALRGRRVPSTNPHSALLPPFALRPATHAQTAPPRWPSRRSGRVRGRWWAPPASSSCRRPCSPTRCLPASRRSR
jgi:hypothetical protein